jgi:hypothetical protein
MFENGRRRIILVRELEMSEDLQRLLDAARKRNFTVEEKEEHRRSFAYGNTNIENSRVTRAIIDREADNLAREKADSNK